MEGVFGVEMDPSIVAEGWERLHDRYYKRTELYRMQWGDKVKLERSQVIGASCGGALGMCCRMVLSASCTLAFVTNCVH